METVTSSHVAHAWNSCVFFCRETAPLLPPVLFALFGLFWEEIPSCTSFWDHSFLRRFDMFPHEIGYGGEICVRRDLKPRKCLAYKEFHSATSYFFWWKHWSHLVWKWYSENKKPNQLAVLYSNCYLMPSRLMQIPRSQIYWPQTEPQLNRARICNLLPLDSAILNKIIPYSIINTLMCPIDPVPLKSCMPIACTDSPLIIGLFCIVLLAGHKEKRKASNSLSVNEATCTKDRPACRVHGLS